MISQSLLFKVEQDDEYIVIKSLNSNEKYEMILFSSDDKLSENQKTSSLVIVNKFYLKIQSMEKEYSSEL